MTGEPASAASNGVGDDTEDVVTALLTASRVLVAIAARSIAALGDTLTVPQFRLLVVLKKGGPSNQSRLAEQLRVNPSTALRMLERMTAAGLVRRTANPSSKREIQVELTAAGDEAVQRVTSVRRAELTRIVASMPHADRGQLIAVLTAFNDAADEPPDELPGLPGWQ
ncbi:MAG TPA: MarR family transcriptional regulator [Streptosporangiaceae bacterium]|jgi:DNA-binding MarR family transcriptional regulator